jgi:hypothetical protein
MLRRVALVRIYVSEELRASIIRVTRIGVLGTLAETSNRRTVFVTIMMEAIGSSETAVFTRTTQLKNPEDPILHSHRHGNIKSDIRDMYQFK